MKDIFLDYEVRYKEYMRLKDLDDKLKLYQLDIFEDMYYNILELQTGNDLVCLDNISLNDYIKLVSNEFKGIIRGYQGDMKALERELVGPFTYYKEICAMVDYCSLMPFEFLLEILKELDIQFRHPMIHDGLYDAPGMTIWVLDNGEYMPFIFWGDMVELAKVKDGSIEFNSLFEYLLGTDFIIFYINYIYNNGVKNARDICREYKNTCLNR